MKEETGQNIAKKISNLIKNHKYRNFHDVYGDEDFKTRELGIKKIKVKNIIEESIDNLKQGSLEYFYNLIFSDKKKLLLLLARCKQELSLVKIKGKKEYWCCGVGNNRPFFLKYFGYLIDKDWVYAEIREVDIKSGII